MKTETDLNPKAEASFASAIWLGLRVMGFPHFLNKLVNRWTVLDLGLRCTGKETVKRVDCLTADHKLRGSCNRNFSKLDCSNIGLKKHNGSREPLKTIL